MRIALAQFNPLVGDIAGNAAKIALCAQEARAAGAQLLVTPELALSGMDPEDLLLRDDFYQSINQVLDSLLEIDGITLVIGHPFLIGSTRVNAATVMRDGHILGRHDKLVLSNEGVLDECRYFTPGVVPLVFDCEGVSVGLLIGQDLDEVDPATESVANGAQLLLHLNAVPFYVDRLQVQQEMARHRVRETGVPLVSVNLVGGQDELVFDGGSFALNAQGELVMQTALFEEGIYGCDWVSGKLIADLQQPVLPVLDRIYQALVVAVRDYVCKNGFPGVVLGLSGGLDSALTLAIAVDALGADKVETIMMPSPYTAQISLDDARKMASIVGVTYHEVAIWPVYEQFLHALSPVMDAAGQGDTTEENIQARVRGTMLMALSNRSGKLVLTTGNKSELATGYCTLYGDMAGGYAVIKDVPKTLAYELARWRNREQEIIPERIIERSPSAELRPGQVDQDNLPPYEVLDAIMALYVEDNQSVESIIAKGFTREDVIKVTRLLRVAEYKRQQGAIGPKITRRAFGRDWRMPVTNRFRSEGKKS